MLVSLREVIREAREKHIAVANFNTTNSETLFAVLDAAEKLGVPLIIAHAQLHDNVAPLDRIGPIMVAAAKASKINVCVHLDHGEDFDYCRRAIAIGFTSVMIDCSALPYEENIKATKEVVDYAHAHGVDVEAELGCLPEREGGGVPGAVPTESLYTKPDLVPQFLKDTGVDALAIAFGTAHGIYKVKPLLNFNIIKEVRALTDIPLVMHGGSGISPDEYREAIACGIDKINYYTYMSYDGYAAAKAYAEKVPADFYHVLASEAQAAMEKNAARTLAVFSEGMKR